jgi:hypothetical protein
LVEDIDQFIVSIDTFIEKQNKKESTCDDLAKIFYFASKLCEVTAETIETSEEISTLCSILKIAAELVSLIHPLLLQLQKHKIDIINNIEIKFEENFEVFVSKIIDDSIKKEIMNKENIHRIPFN